MKGKGSNLLPNYGNEQIFPTLIVGVKYALAVTKSS